MEVNMRPAGGHDPDMMNYAQSIDVFQIYAEMVTTGKRVSPPSDARYYCAYVGRKDGHAFTHSHEEMSFRHLARVYLYATNLTAHIALHFQDVELTNKFFQFHNHIID